MESFPLGRHPRIPRKARLNVQALGRNALHLPMRLRLVCRPLFPLRPQARPDQIRPKPMARQIYQDLEDLYTFYLESEVGRGPMARQD